MEDGCYEKSYVAIGNGFVEVSWTKKKVTLPYQLVTYFGCRFWPIFGHFFATTVKPLFDVKSSNQLYICIIVIIIL